MTAVVMGALLPGGLVLLVAVAEQTPITVRGTAVSASGGRKLSHTALKDSHLGLEGGGGLAVLIIAFVAELLEGESVDIRELAIVAAADRRRGLRDVDLHLDPGGTELRRIEVASGGHGATAAAASLAAAAPTALLVGLQSRRVALPRPRVRRVRVRGPLGGVGVHEEDPCGGIVPLQGTISEDL